MHIFRLIYSILMSPNQQVHILKLREQRKNLGVWLFVCSFSFLLSSCLASHSSSTIDHDSVIAQLKIQKQFGNFINAHAISADAFGNIYVADAGAPGIIKFNSNGDSIRVVIGFGKEHNQFDDPRSIDASLTNSVAIAD